MATSRQLAAYIYKNENLERIQSDFERYKIYNGKVRDTIKEAIVKEFKKPETVRELHKRVVPINIIQKIVKKLAGVYRMPPVRSPLDEDQSDQETIDFFVKKLDLNKKMKDMNRYFKLNKNAACEPFVDGGEQKLRILPSHTYTQFSDNPVDPETPTATIKHIDMSGGSRNDHVHIVWTEDRHYSMDGYGRILQDYGNRYGINPIVYVKEGEELTPISDDDLLFMQICICLLLTDLAFGAKYQSWSVVYILGAETQNLTFNPNSVVTIPMSKGGEKPEIGTIDPKLDSDSILKMTEALIGLLLTTKSLSIGSVSVKLEGGNEAAGVAKVLDQAESTEDQMDQRSFFQKVECELWYKLAIMQKVWIEEGELDAKNAAQFSEEFEVEIEFPDPRPVISEKEVVETEKLKLEAGLTTTVRSLKKLNPEMPEQAILDLEEEIRLENTTIKEDGDTKTNGVTTDGGQGSNEDQLNGTSNTSVQ